MNWRDVPVTWGDVADAAFAALLGAAGAVLLFYWL